MSARQHRLRTASIFVGLALAALVFAAVVVLESGVLTPKLLDWANARLTPAAGLRMTTSAVYLRPWKGLTLHDVRFTVGPDSAGAAGTASPRYVLSIGELAVGYRFFGLLGDPPHLDRLRVTRPDLDLDQLRRWREREGERGGRTGGGAGAGGGGLRIDDLRIVEGMVRRGGVPRASGVSLVGRLDGAGGDWALSIDRGGAHVTTGRFDEDVELTGSVSASDGTLELAGLHLGVGGGRVSFRGDVTDGVLHLVTSGYAIPLERMGSWLGLAHPVLSGELEFRFLTTGRLDSLRVEGGLRGVGAEGTGRQFRFAAAREGDEVRVETLDVRSGESRVELGGRFTLTDPPAIEGVAAFRRLDPAALLGEPDLARVTGLEGVLRFRGTGATRETFDGSVVVDVDRATVFGMDLDEASLDVAMQDGSVMLRDARLTRGGSSVEGSGSVDADNVVAAELTGTIADLADLGGFAGESPAALHGQATAEVQVTGPLAGPNLEAVLRFEEAEVLGIRAAGLDLNLESEELREGGAVEIDVVGRDIGYADRVLPVGVASGTWRRGALTVTDLRLESDGGGELRLGGDLRVDDTGTLSGRVTRLEVTESAGAARWTNAAPIRIEKTPDALTFAGLDLRSDAGQVTGDVSIDRSGGARVRAAGRGVDVAAFSPYLLPPEPISGTLGFDATATVGADTLAVDVDLDLRDGAYGGDRIDEVEGRFRLRDDRIELDGVKVRSAFAAADVRGELGLAGGGFREALADSAGRHGLGNRLLFRDVRVQFDTPDADRLKEVLPWFPSPGGSVRLVADLAGPSPAPGLDLQLDVENGRVGVAPLDRLTATGTYDGTVLTVQSARLESGDGVLVAEGRVPVEWSFLHLGPELAPGGAMDVTFDADGVPAGGLAMLSPLFEMSEGPVFAKGKLTGVVDSLLWLEGTFRSDGVRLTIPEFEDPLVDGHVDGLFYRDGIVLQSVRFADGLGGSVHGSGTLRLPNLEFTGMDIELRGESYHYRSPRGVSALGDGAVRVTEKARSDGKLVANFTGRFDVERADLDQRIFLAAEAAAENVPDLPQGVKLPEGARRAPGDPTALPESEPTPLFASIELHADRNVWLKTEEMELELAGDVTFLINEETVGLTGEAHTLRGRYAVLNTDFDVERAELRFVDPTDMMASVIDAEATTRVLDEDVAFDVSGTIGDPIVVGHTESGMSEAEIYELLALRQKRTTEPDDQETEQGVVSNAFLESWGALLATRFGRGLSREFGLDTFDVEVEGQEQAVRVGKYLGPGVFVRYRERIGGQGAPADELEVLETPERQLLLEYRLSEILQLQGETGVIQDDPYVNVDLKAEWGY
jgi:autotransporter translocation and assembly factor TamB